MASSMLAFSRLRGCDSREDGHHDCDGTQGDASAPLQDRRRQPGTSRSPHLHSASNDARCRTVVETVLVCSENHGTVGEVCADPARSDQDYDKEASFGEHVDADVKEVTLMAVYTTNLISRSEVGKRWCQCMVGFLGKVFLANSRSDSDEN